MNSIIMLLYCFAILVVDDTIGGVIISEGPFVNNKAELPSNLMGELIGFKGENITLTLPKPRTEPLVLPLIATDSAFQLSFTASRGEDCIEAVSTQKWNITYPSKSDVVPLSIIWWDHAASLRYDDKASVTAIARTSFDIFLDGRSAFVKEIKDDKRMESLTLLSPLEAPALPDKNFDMSFKIINVNDSPAGGSCDITLEFNGAVFKIYKAQPTPTPEPDDEEPIAAASTTDANYANSSEGWTTPVTNNDDLILILGSISTCCFCRKRFRRSQKMDQSSHVENGRSVSKVGDAATLQTDHGKGLSECAIIPSECALEEVTAKDYSDEATGTEKQPDANEEPVKSINQNVSEQQQSETRDVLSWVNRLTYLELSFFELNNGVEAFMAELEKEWEEDSPIVQWREGEQFLLAAADVHRVWD
uniref:Uncharacterized protein n=1 Tax=Ditylenchus dipsaci TaxID=166011 RepID=A0A915CV75_9BILA